MCMEDVRIGRKENHAETLVSVTTTAQQLVGGSPRRTCLIISPPLSGTLTVWTSNAVISGSGINIPSTGDPLILTILEHGQLCTAAWWGIMSAGTVVVGTLETILTEE